MNIGNLTQLTEFEMKTPSGEKLSLAYSLSDFANIKTLLVHHEVLLPGRRASGAHFHSVKEEISIVLSGTPSVWLDGRTCALKAGDFVGFNAREQVAHMLLNTSDEPAIILTIGTNPRDDVTTFVEVTGVEVAGLAEA